MEEKKTRTSHVIQQDLQKALDTIQKYEDAKTKLNPLEAEAKEAKVKAGSLMSELHRSIGLEEPTKRKPYGRTGGTRTKSADSICGLCEVVTVPPHDRRQHRGKHPGKWSKDQSRELGYIVSRDATEEELKVDRAKEAAKEKRNKKAGYPTTSTGITTHEKEVETQSSPNVQKAPGSPGALLFSSQVRLSDSAL
jgi:hypothetical protein